LYGGAKRWSGSKEKIWDGGNQEKRNRGPKGRKVESARGTCYSKESKMDQTQGGRLGHEKPKGARTCKKKDQLQLP